jgi:hypothetical protein
VIQCGGSPSFAPKTLQDLGIARILGQELERDRASKSNILGSVNNAHASFTELFDNAKVGDVPADDIFSLRQLRMITQARCPVNAECENAKLSIGSLSSVSQRARSVSSLCCPATAPAAPGPLATNWKLRQSVLQSD